MARFAVELNIRDERLDCWLVVDTITDRIVYRDYSSKERALEVAECRNWDEENEIFAEFA